MQRLVSQYGAARQDILQDALNGSIAVCTRGVTQPHAFDSLCFCIYPHEVDSEVRNSRDAR